MLNYKNGMKMALIEGPVNGAIFLAICNAILLLRNVNLCQTFGMLKIYSFGKL